MLCKLCTKYFIKEDSFANLFDFESICNDCKKQFKPKLNYEIIPIFSGEIYYFYLYEDMQLSLTQETHLDKYIYLLYNQILLRNQGYDLVIYLDDYLFNNLEEVKFISLGYVKIFMFSLTRKSLETKDIIL
ncbi:MAG: hypothetical protein ACQERX_00120 [Bacillota bacterium]